MGDKPNIHRIPQDKLQKKKLYEKISENPDSLKKIYFKMFNRDIEVGVYIWIYIYKQLKAFLKIHSFHK